MELDAEDVTRSEALALVVVFRGEHRRDFTGANEAVCEQSVAIDGFQVSAGSVELPRESASLSEQFLLYSPISDFPDHQYPDCTGRFRYHALNYHIKNYFPIVSKSNTTNPQRVTSSPETLFSNDMT